MRTEPHPIYLSGHGDLNEPFRALYGANARQPQTVVVEDADAAFAAPGSARALTDAIFALTHCRWILLAREASAMPLDAWLTGRICDEPVADSDLRLDLDEAMRIARRLGVDDEEIEPLWRAADGHPLEFSARCFAPPYREAVLSVWERASR